MGESGSLDDRLNIVIVGAGRVGSTTAYAVLLSGLADCITLVDSDPARAEGEAMDLIHGLPYLPPATVRSGGFEACAQADAVVLCAGAARQPGDSRLDLARRNLELLRSLLPNVVQGGFGGILILVSNPVDLLTRAAQRLSGLPPAKVIGTGTALDTARLRTALARHLQVDARNVHAYVLGEHGETEVPAWSLARIGNLTLSDFARATGQAWGPEIQGRISQEVRSAGAEVIRRKGATNYAIGLATARILRAILRDERSILTVSTVLDEASGFPAVALSLPCMVGRSGRIATLPLQMEETEAEALRESARTLARAYEEAGGPQELAP